MVSDTPSKWYSELLTKDVAGEVSIPTTDADMFPPTLVKVSTKTEVVVVSRLPVTAVSLH